MKILTRITGIGAACVCLTFAGAGKADDISNALKPTSRIELFNGKDFTGWMFFMRDNADPTNAWSIADGVIKCTGRPAGYMRTTQNYRDYKLTVEWRFVRAGNTGVLVHMSEPDKIWPKSIECQGQSGNQGDFYVIDGTDFKERRGMEGRRMAKRGESNEKPVGEWNTYEIICAGNTIKPYVNGKLMNEATECTVSSGKICLQSEGTEIEIRKVVLEPAE